jgi:ABC-type polar amino acid transport system ATPase subunit
VIDFPQGVRQARAMLIDPRQLLLDALTDARNELPPEEFSDLIKIMLRTFTQAEVDELLAELPENPAS